jgi:hypothetical protein
MTLTIATEQLAVSIDESTGALIGVRNLARGLELVAARVAAPPFRLELAETGWVEGFSSFSHRPLGGGVRLAWETPYGVTVTSDVLPRGQEVTLSLAVTNHGRVTVDRVEYPIIAGVGRLGGAGQDELVHSHGTGMLFRDPLDLFEPDPENHRRLRRSAYPEGFAGSTMQLMAYYARGRGGFFIGTEDAGADMKWYNAFKEGELLWFTLMHKAPTPARGRDFRPPYPVVLTPLVAGSWHEAADRYKRWALQQPWAAERPRSRWLLERVGLCTFGVNARYDRSAWLDMFHQIAGTPVLHILGPNWAKYGHDYYNTFPRGRADWFPATFSAANLATIRRNGDYWAPFLFDLLCDSSEALPDPVLPARVVPKPSELPSDAPWFPYMCAGSDYWRELHAWRDAVLASEYGCDARYYDISASNLPMQCLASGHRHHPGAGTPVVDAFRAMYRETAAAAERAKGAPVPGGCEVISEALMGEFDFYQARAEASPLAPFEVDCFRDWIAQGRAEKIPLFAYVYHERGPLRLDGWGTLAREAGDLFYWAAARVVLNGGLLELNYEFSGLEDLGGLRDDPNEHYFRFAPRTRQIDPARAAFAGAAARMRTGPANPFLAYGTMLPPPAVEAPEVELDYCFYNVFPGPTHQERGRMRVPSALATAWRYEDRSAWCLANLLDREQTVMVDGTELRLPARSFRTHIV